MQKPSGNGCAWEAPLASTAKSTPAPSALAETQLPPTIQAFIPLPPKVPTTKEGLFVEDYIKMMSYPNVAMVISTDLGGGIHPINKSGFGGRAARVALGVAYTSPWNTTVQSTSRTQSTATACG